MKNIFVFKVKFWSTVKLCYNNNGYKNNGYKNNNYNEFFGPK